MLTFLTFFLGLVIGTWDVELAVDDSIAAVEVRLDGERVERRMQPPWVVPVDFGRSLRPHLLEAIAFDERGEEIERIVQRINLPRDQAEAGLVLERSADGSRYAAVSLVWRVVDSREPSELFIDFDGIPLEVSEAGRAVLPAHDPEIIHIVSGEAVFGESSRATADLAFGGVYGEAVSSKLTAVVLVRKKGRLPTPEELAGQILVDNQSVRVTAVEKGRAEVIVARDDGAWQELSSFWLEATRSALSQGRGRRSVTAADFVEAGLQDEDSVRLIATRPQFRTEEDGRVLGFFPLTVNVNDRRGGGLSGAVLNLMRPVESPAPQALTSAVALAGIRAAASNQRRAVVLVRSAGGTPEDGHDPNDVREFLGSLLVPLHVWDIVPESGEVETGQPWGEADRIASLRRFNRSVRLLENALEDQVVVWLDGDFFPNKVTLSPQLLERFGLAGQSEGSP